MTVTRQPTSPSAEARRLVQGFRVYQLIVTACELRVPDLLAAGSATAAELAEATRTDAPSLRRFLRGLQAVGAVTESAGRYSGTAVLDDFRSDRPGLRNMTLMLSQEAYRAWGDLTYSVRTGKPAFEHVFGRPRWELLGEDPQAAALFNAAMVELTGRVTAGFLDAYDLTAVRSVVDVGGGNGAMLAAILKANPGTRGVLFDLPQGLAGARDNLDALGVGDRVELVEGSFFDSVPAGADLYVLKSIVHDWDDARATAILESCAQAMNGESKLVLIERLLPDTVTGADHDLDIVMSDLNMMVVLGGKERTEQEYAELLRATGLAHTRTLKAGVSGFGIFEAVPARRRTA